MKNNIPGFVNDAKLEVLSKWVSNLPDSINAVEVGSYCGRSAYTISNSLKPNSKLICIDDFRLPVNEDAYRFAKIPVAYTGKNSKENLLNNLKECNNVEVIEGQGDTYTLDNTMFVFIDDSHFNPDFRKNLRHWWNILLPNGVICGDDFYEYDFKNDKMDVIPEVLNLAKEFKLKIEIEQSMWRIQK